MFAPSPYVAPATGNRQSGSLEAIDNYHKVALRLGIRDVDDAEQTALLDVWPIATRDLFPAGTTRRSVGEHLLDLRYANWRL